MLDYSNNFIPICYKYKTSKAVNFNHVSKTSWRQAVYFVGSAGLLRDSSRQTKLCPTMVLGTVL